MHTTLSLDKSLGGLARSVPQLAIAQAREGHDVSIWCARPEPGTIPDIGAKCISDIRIINNALDEIYEKGQDPDVVHDHGTWLPFHHQVAKYCSKRSIVRVVSPRGMLEPWALGHKALKKTVAWQVYQKRDLSTAHALHATSIAESQNLSELGFKQPIFVHPNGVEVPSHPCFESRSNDNELELDRTRSMRCDLRRTALYVGRIHPVKGLLNLVEAWSKVMPPGWSMRIVGADDGGHLAEVRENVMSRGLEETWIFEGSLEGDRKWEALNRADLFILPTFSENFGITVAEALIAGLPVITTTGAPWEGLLAHKCGWQVSPTVDAIAGALAEATITPLETLSEMGKRGRDWSKKEFAWPSISSDMIESYQRLLDG